MTEADSGKVKNQIFLYIFMHKCMIFCCFFLTKNQQLLSCLQRTGGAMKVFAGSYQIFELIK